MYFISSNDQPNHCPDPTRQNQNRQNDSAGPVRLCNLLERRRIAVSTTSRTVVSRARASGLVGQGSSHLGNQVALDDLESAQLLTHAPGVVPSHRGVGRVGEPLCAAGDAVGAAGAGCCCCHGRGGEVRRDEVGEERSHF